MTGPLASLIHDALSTVAREAPSAYARIRASLGGHGVAVATREESFVVEIGDTSIVRAPGPEPEVIAIRCDAAAIDALVHGEIDLVDALLADRITIVGSAADLCRAADAVAAFVQGAVRCTGMESLLGRLTAFSDTPCREETPC